jgi:hypothetical protein
MKADSMVENYMTRPVVVQKVRRIIDHEAISGYTKAIDLLDDVCMELVFPGADIFRAEIHAMQRRMQDELFRLEGM